MGGGVGGGWALGGGGNRLMGQLSRGQHVKFHNYWGKFKVYPLKQHAVWGGGGQSLEGKPH